MSDDKWRNLVRGAKVKLQHPARSSREGGKRSAPPQCHLPLTAEFESNIKEPAGARCACPLPDCFLVNNSFAQGLTKAVRGHRTPKTDILFVTL